MSGRKHAGYIIVGQWAYLNIPWPLDAASREISLVQVQVQCNQLSDPLLDARGIICGWARIWVSNVHDSNVQVHRIKVNGTRSKRQGNIPRSGVATVGLIVLCSQTLGPGLRCSTA